MNVRNILLCHIYWKYTLQMFFMWDCLWSCGPNIIMCEMLSCKIKWLQVETYFMLWKTMLSNGTKCPIWIISCTWDQMLPCGTTCYHVETYSNIRFFETTITVYRQHLISVTNKWYSQWIFVMPDKILSKLVCGCMDCHVQRFLSCLGTNLIEKNMDITNFLFEYFSPARIA